jgi:hypothetical protein
MQNVSNKPDLMFASGAVFNLLAGLPMLLAPAAIAGLAGITWTPATPMLLRMLALAIIGFGWAYWMIAREPQRLRPIILLGAALKVAFITLAFGYWLSGAISFFLPAVAVGDVIYTFLFLAYYRRTA